MTKTLKKIVITSGGTGGHIFPAYSLAKYFEKQGTKVQLTSDLRGLKYLKNYPDIETVTIDSFRVNIKNIIKILFSIIKSLSFLISFKPNLVFGMGGYSSFPVCFAAAILRIPFIIYENNLQIGKANNFLLKFTNKVLVANEELEGVSQKNKKKLSRVGNIIRKEIIEFGEQNQKTDKNKNLRILVLGGSQAAKIFAQVLPQIFKRCVDSKIPIQVFQQCLPDQNEYLENFYKHLDIDFEIFNFTDNILSFFSKSNLVITRSGSSMLAELINAKKPFISIPLPSSADNHQLKNAIYYEKNKYSFLIEEKNLGKELFPLLEKINNDMSLLDQIKTKQSQYSDKLVFRNIDKELEFYLK